MSKIKYLFYSVLFIAFVMIACISEQIPIRPKSEPAIKAAEKAIDDFKKDKSKNGSQDLLYNIENLISIASQEKVYSDYLEKESLAKDKIIAEKNKEIADLENEIGPYRKFKLFVGIGTVGYVIFLIIGWYFRNFGFGAIGNIIGRFTPHK